MPDIAEMPDVDQAMARLEALEAAEQPPPAEAFVQTEAESETQQPAPQPDPGTKVPNSSSTDTPAASEPKPSAEPKTPKSEITPPPKPGEAKGSAFASDAQRRDTSWKALNTEKQAHQQAVETFKAQQQLFQREQEQFKLERAKSAQKFTPEQYEQASVQRI